MVETTLLKSTVKPWNDTNLNHAGEGALPWIYVFESLGTGQTPRKHSLNEEKCSQTVQVCFRPQSEHVSLLSYPPVDSHWNMSSALMNYKSVKYFSPAARGDCSLTWQWGWVQAGTRDWGSRGNGTVCGSTRGLPNHTTRPCRRSRGVDGAPQQRGRSGGAGAAWAGGIEAWGRRWAWSCISRVSAPGLRGEAGAKNTQAAGITSCLCFWKSWTTHGQSQGHLANVKLM